MKAMVRLLLVGIVFGCLSCDRPDTGRARAPVSPLSEAEIEDRIRAELKRDRVIGQAFLLEVTVDGDRNEATLSGILLSELERRRAIALVQRAHDGLTINDKIDVRPAG